MISHRLAVVVIGNQMQIRIPHVFQLAKKQDISILTVEFEDQARTCGMDTPTSRQKQILRLSLFELLALFAALLIVILTLGNDAILAVPN